MPLSAPVSGTLGEFNVGLAAAAAIIAPLGAQIDALIAIGLGPFQAELSAQLNASLSLQATLTLQISDPTVSLQLAIAAVAQLQAALQAALTLPSINIGLSAELSASVAIIAALQVRLGGLQLALELALRLKLGALNLLAQLQASLSAGPAFAYSFTGDTLATTGAQISGEFTSGLSDPPNTILPSDQVSGIIIVTKDPAVAAALSAIITV